MLRDGQTGDWIGTFIGHKGAVWSARMSTDVTKAVTASADFTAKVWDTYTGNILASFPHQHIVRGCDFSGDGSRIVTGGMEKKLRIFDLNRDDLAGQPILAADGHTSVIRNVVWDGARNMILSSGDDMEIRVWDPRTFNQVHSCKMDGPIASMELSADGEYITSTTGKSVYFWDAQTYTLRKHIKTEYDVSAVSLHPNHTRFVAGGSSDLWVRIYDFDSGRELEVYKGHHGPVHTVSYSPDGELYATGSEDGTIRLWQTTPGKRYGLWQGDGNEDA
ncbi:hypothetical protein FBU30_009026 [Linnemannia zychae]|nr:hypothetical protein FBU30_009026 [Linnemannia zychae]